MDQAYATRSELLARRARIRLTVQGGELLKERRGALIKESGRLGASVLESIDLLDREIAGAGQLLGIAVADELLIPLQRVGWPRAGARRG